MPIIEVALHITEEIAAGLASGEYKRIGGVIYKAGNGETVKWLREVAGTRQQEISLPQGIPGMEAMMGLQVLDTAIMVAGFAMLSVKMDALSRQCDAILDRMDSVDRHLQWLRDADIATVQSKLHAALEGAHTAHRLGQSVLPYDTTINEAALFFRRMLGDMLKRGSVVRDQEMFTLLLTQHAVAVVARARSQWLLLGPEDGLRALDQGRQAHADLVASFQRSLRDPETGVSMVLDLSAEQRDGLKTIAALFGYVTQRLADRREELAGWAAMGLEAPAAPEILRQLESHPTACLVITLDAEAAKVPLGRESV